MIGIIKNHDDRDKNRYERIWMMAKVEFKLRFYENKLGLLWALLKPVSEMFIFYIAFEVILNQGVENFVSFIFLGLITWNLFVEFTTGTIAILKTKQYLYEYSNINKLEIYISSLLSSLFGFIFNLLIFIAFYLISGNTISIYALYAPLVIMLVIIQGFGLSLILSHLFLLAKDINQIWTIIITMGFWISPILFKAELFRENLPGVDFLNPMAGVIINIRNVLMYNQPPDWALMGIDFMYGIVFFVIGLALLKRLGPKSSELL